MTELINEFHASLVRLHPFVFDDLVDQFVLAVSECAYRFELRGIVSASLRQFDAARSEKISNAIKTRLSVYIEPVVIGEIERAKCFASLVRTLLQVLVEHPFPTRGVQDSGVGYHSIE